MGSNCQSASFSPVQTFSKSDSPLFRALLTAGNTSSPEIQATFNPKLRSSSNSSTLTNNFSVSEAPAFTATLILYFAIHGSAGIKASRKDGSYAASTTGSNFEPPRDVMLASDIQSPTITSTGSFGWFVAKESMAWRRSEAEPLHPAIRIGR